MKKLVFSAVVVLLLLIPVAVMAQDKIVELMLTDNGTKLGITDTINSVANISVELNGKQYLVSVPVKIDIDTTIPLSTSLVAVDSNMRVANLGFDILEINESAEDIDVIMPGSFGDEEKEYKPSSETNKIIVVNFVTTNSSDKETQLSSYSIQGVDETGRLFEETELGCENMNPGETGNCVIIFDVDQKVNIVALDIELPDHRQLPIPK